MPYHGPLTRSDVREHISNATDDLDFVLPTGQLGRGRSTDDPQIMHALALIARAGDLLGQAYDAVCEPEGRRPAS